MEEEEEEEDPDEDDPEEEEDVEASEDDPEEDEEASDDPDEEEDVEASLDTQTPPPLGEACGQWRVGSAAAFWAWYNLHCTVSPAEAPITPVVGKAAQADKQLEVLL